MGMGVWSMGGCECKTCVRVGVYVRVGCVGIGVYTKLALVISNT